MKIHFKSTNKPYNEEKPNIIEFKAKVDREFDEGFEVLTFVETRSGKNITNRVEYNNDTLRIYSGITSLTCKLNEVIKNHYVIEEMKSHSFYIYSKMTKMVTSNPNDLIFEYLISSSPDDFKNAISIILEMKIEE